MRNKPLLFPFRTPHSALARLETLPVMETGSDRLNFPTTHPLYGTEPALRRGLEQVRNGYRAVIAAQLPTLVQEMGLS